jgi:hypothetical protein
MFKGLQSSSHVKSILVEEGLKAEIECPASKSSEAGSLPRIRGRRTIDAYVQPQFISNCQAWQAQQSGASVKA